MICILPEKERLIKVYFDKFKKPLQKRSYLDTVVKTA